MDSNHAAGAHHASFRGRAEVTDSPQHEASDLFSIDHAQRLEATRQYVERVNRYLARPDTPRYVNAHASKPAHGE